VAEGLEAARGGKSSSNLIDGVSHPPDLVLSVSNSDASQRLDVFLSRQLVDCSRNYIQTLIKGGHVLNNGLPVKPSYEIRSGDRISVRLPKPDHPNRLTPQSMALHIIHEDDDIVVINKAPGMVVHPGAGHSEGTLVHGLLAHCPRLAGQGAPLRPGIVHRLDQHTSGVLVVAKSDGAYLDLINQFKEHTVEKHYLALVYGSFSQAGGMVTTMLGRHPADRKKIAVLQGRGREAVTRWQVKRAWEEVTLLRVTIETGRTHQIRVHLSYVQHPVVGDATYGGGKRKARLLRSKDLQDLLMTIDRQMLHAEILAFRHPKTRNRMIFEAPPPDDFELVLKQLEANFPLYQS
jgi:23S rRNA pseudouridine1911/1915/1917 synthase